MSRWIVWISLIALVVCAACTGLGSSPVPSRFPGLLALPSVVIQGDGCAGVGLGDNAVFAGDPDDPRVAWVQQGIARMDVDFPPWLGARFTPELEIVDASGQVIARTGDRVEGGCAMGDGKPLLVLWP